MLMLLDKETSWENWEEQQIFNSNYDFQFGKFRNICVLLYKILL